MILLPLLVLPIVIADPDEKRLIDDLFGDHNKLAFPNEHPNEVLKILLQFKLIQILDVHEKNQVLKLNGFLQQAWRHYQLSWNPEEYGNITLLHIPGDLIWLPDIILYNNADGSPQVTTVTKASLYHNGVIMWEPPVIYNSMCQIQIEWFPFDEQDCELKFGSWTYHGHAIDLIFPPHTKPEKSIDAHGNEYEVVQRAIELTDYQESGEWDLMSVKGIRHKGQYPCCDYPFIDITYYLSIRRKTLFYSINLITPCVGIALMSSTVFYLPSNSNQKMALSVSVLVSIALFFLLLADIIPPTSLSIPLIAKYLIFSMSLVSFSIGVSVVTLNIHYKAGMAYPMPKWVKKVFLHILPSMLFVNMRRYVTSKPPPKSLLSWVNDRSPLSIKMLSTILTGALSDTNFRRKSTKKKKPKRTIPPEFRKAYENACYIAETMRQEDIRSRLKEDWKFVAMVIDRLFLIFYIVCMVSGTLMMFMSAPYFHDSRIPISHVIRAEAAANNESESQQDMFVG